MDNDNFIIISGAKIGDITEAIKQWIALYSDQLKTDFDFEIYKYVSDSYLIIPRIKMDFNFFNFLVNYLYYPESIDYKAKVVGYSFNNTIEQIPKEFSNKDFLIYVPENDTEYDNVFAITSEKKHLKIDFGGKIKPVSEVKDYIIPQIDFSQLYSPDIISTRSKEINKIKEDKTNAVIQKRFKILRFIALILILLSPMLSLKDSQTFSMGIFGLGYAIGFWFHSDYKMLRINQYYIKCILFAALFGLFGLFVARLLKIEYDLFIFLGVISPLWFLIIQRPIRLLFRKILKREPEVGNRDVSFGDKLYSIILFLCLFFVPFIFVMKYVT